MGRRPNALIGEFFRRGRKLNDNSNRYEHQCTKCGEMFPKGRIDGMLTHLVKRCPNMTQENRDLVFQHINGNARSSNMGTEQAQQGGQDDEIGLQDTAINQDEMLHSTQHQHQHQQMHFSIPADAHQNMHGVQNDMQQQQIQLDLLLQPEQSALDTLAEVSRRHHDFSEFRNMPQMGAQTASMMPNPGPDLAEHTLFHELQRQAAEQINGHDATNPGAVTTFPGFDQQAVQGATNYILPNNLASLPLVQTATAANQQLEQSQVRQPQHNHSSSIDPQLASHFDGNTQPPPNHESSQPSFLAWTESPQDFVTQQSPPTNQPAPGFDSTQHTPKNTARARFTDNRRKQVQEIRKQGACIRCRMLKKPCSEGTPCKTCQNVDTARLWKGACLRTRIAEECTLFSTSYFHSLAKAAEEPVAIHRPVDERVPGGVEVKLFADSELAIAFAAIRSVAAESTDGAVDITQSTASNEIALLDEGEGMSAKISKYCSHDATISACIENEPNVFLKTTLQQASKLLKSEAVTEKASAQKVSVRANYISPSQLLKQVLELWVETIILASSSSTGTMVIHYNPSADPAAPLNPADHPSTSQIPPTSRTHHRIRAQLLAATEIRAHTLSKTVLNELERRLLQRQQVSAFSTFIAAVVLLNCVERMTAFYHTLDLATTAFHLPLSCSLDALGAQGPRFAALLTTLLRMRALPPTTARTDDGDLAVVQTLGLSVRLNGVASRDAGLAEETARKAAAWLDPLHLSVENLISIRDGLGEQESDGWRSWDCRFVAGVVLPEGV